MSCLALAELTLSEQAEVQQSCALAMEARVRTLLAPFELLAEPAAPLGLAPSSPAGSSNPLLTAEHTAMIESQCTEHPPLQVCHPGHLPKMFEARGDLKVQYYVSCGACGVRTPRYQTQGACADAWAHRDVMPIKAVA